MHVLLYITSSDCKQANKLSRAICIYIYIFIQSGAAREIGERERSWWTRSLLNSQHLLRVGIRKDCCYNVLILSQNCTRSLKLHLPGLRGSQSAAVAKCSSRRAISRTARRSIRRGAHRARHPLTKIRAGVQLSLHYGTGCRCRQEKKAFVGVLSSPRASPALIAVAPRPRPFVIVIVAVIDGKSSALLEHSSRVRLFDAAVAVREREGFTKGIRGRTRPRTDNRARPAPRDL